jgi:hypothetical protein
MGEKGQNMPDNFEGMEGQEGTPVEGGQGSQGGEGQHVQDPNTGKFIPIERFNAVYGKVKEYEGQINQYKGFGNPNDLKAKLEKLTAWEKAVEDQRKQASMTPSEQEQAKRTAQLRRELEQVYPEIAEVKRMKELQDELNTLKGSNSESKATAQLEKHSISFTGVLKAAKLDTKFQPKIEEYIVSQMSDEEKQRFVAGDFKVAEEIFNRELKDGLFSAMRGKPSLPTPPMRNTPGGTPPMNSKKPMTMKEAEDEAWSRMNGE